MKLSDDDIRARLAAPSGEWRSEQSLIDSAVLAVVVERDGVDRLVFTQRRDDLPVHAGQISFPGGAREGEEDAVSCAVRETCEEVGLASGGLDVLGRLPDRVSIAGYLVACFAARLSEPSAYEPQLTEVSEVFEVPYAAFLERKRWSTRPTTHPRARFKSVPYFAYGDHTIWGLTGIILRDFVRIAGEFNPTPGV
ncbi:MAG: CoA pyrophosphatase [Planctomycetota bacterium]|jgi:8-oxo-dGTP pyrophosphatase MutT (NUDIX family)|nr:CoA pyrophosphatase [Planctomycetota bacterium]